MQRTARLVNGLHMCEHYYVAMHLPKGIISLIFTGVKKKDHDLISTTCCLQLPGSLGWCLGTRLVYSHVQAFCKPFLPVLHTVFAIAVFTKHFSALKKHRSHFSFS